jgi:PAS domain S-box-containing protein
MEMSAEGTRSQPVGEAQGEGEERFQAIFSQAAVGIAQTGLDSRWLMVNHRFCEMLGYAETELRGKTWQDITHPDDRDKAMAGRRQLLAGEIASHTMEKRYIRKDGTVLWGRIHRSLVRDHDNQPKYIIAVVEDISERKRTEETLRVSQERFDLAQGASRTGTWDWDATSGETHCSSGHGPLYGLPSSDRAPSFEEWLGRIHPEDRARMRTELDRTLESADRFLNEFRVVWPDGTIHWLYGQGQYSEILQAIPSACSA